MQKEEFCNFAKERKHQKKENKKILQKKESIISD